MTSSDLAAQELREAINAIMVVEDPLDTVDVAKYGGVELVDVRLYPAEAIELATWIRSKIEASQNNPYQGQFSFTTE